MDTDFDVVTPTVISKYGAVTRTIYVDTLAPAPAVADANFSLGESMIIQVADPDAWADIPLDPGNTLLKITKRANKPEASIGDIVTYEIKIENLQAWTVAGVYIKDILPAGFKYVDASGLVTRATGSQASEPSVPTGDTGRTRLFNVGDIAGNAVVYLRYQLVVGTGVVFGEYRNTALAQYVSGQVISNQASHKIKVVPDPVFDYATIIGKVFEDIDGDGIQGEGEVGMGGVRIATEDGIVVTTDPSGKYHIAGLRPQTKLLKLEVGSLPEGSELTTENPRLVRFTLGGSLAKVNFGIRPDWVSQVKVMPDRRGSIAEADLALVLITDPETRVKPEHVVVEKGHLSQPVRFSIRSTYASDIDRWWVLILEPGTEESLERPASQVNFKELMASALGLAEAPRDKGVDEKYPRPEGYRVFREFSGTQADLTDDIVWDGRSDDGRLVELVQKYKYVLVVERRAGSVDYTHEEEFTVLSSWALAMRQSLEVDESVPEVTPWARWRSLRDKESRVMVEVTIKRGRPRVKIGGEVVKFIWPALAPGEVTRP
jgi:uncharacterized repeat protein (TIGR01451 family)